MTLNEAIEHARDTAEHRTDLCDECRAEHKQLAEWLEQLVKLTKENESLTATVKVRGETIEELQFFVSEISEENERLSRRIGFDIGAIKADTVREMQTRLAQCIGTYTDKSYVYVSAMFKLVDQIAKEMLEGNDEKR